MNKRIIDLWDKNQNKLERYFVTTNQSEIAWTECLDCGKKFDFFSK